MERLANIAVLAALLTAATATTGCYKRGLAADSAEATGTCEGACQHYVVCSDPQNEDHTYRECMAECREIFTSDGRPDVDTLRDYERMECDKAVSFVEGARAGA